MLHAQIYWRGVEASLGCGEGSLVVIVEGNELAKLPVTGQGSRLIGDSLHVAAISQDDVPIDATPPPLHTGWYFMHDISRAERRKSGLLMSITKEH